MSVQKPEEKPMRKPREQKLLEGTYRKDRDNGGEEVLQRHLETPATINVPKTLTDSEVAAVYVHHCEFLSRIKMLNVSDLPELEMLFNLLQTYRKVNARLATMDVTDEQYDAVLNRVLKLSQHFGKLASRYCISPASRSRMLSDLARVPAEDKSKVTSVTARLLNRDGE
jgi:phage terminase small subunit